MVEVLRLFEIQFVAALMDLAAGRQVAGRMPR
jgi:hypothetical protein